MCGPIISNGGFRHPYPADFKMARNSKAAVSGLIGFLNVFVNNAQVDAANGCGR